MLGGFARTFTKQQAVGREELDAAPAIKAIDFSLFENSRWTVIYTVPLLTSEDVTSKIKSLRGQFDVMYSFYQLLMHPVHHFVGGPVALNTKLLNYGTAKDQMPTAAIMDRTMTVLGLCFGTLKEGDRSAYNVAFFHEFMVDYNNRDGARTTPKPQHVEAWQSPEALLQFAINVYGMHKPEDLDHNVHVNFRPQIFNEPVVAALQHEQNYHTAVHNPGYPYIGDFFDDELFATSVRPGAKAPYKNQLGYHGTQSGGGNPSSRQQTALDRSAADRQ